MVTPGYKWLLLGILALLPAYLLRFSIAGIPTTALEIAIYLSVICYLLSVHLGWTKWQLPERKWLWPIGLFVVGALIGVLISPEKRIALGQFKGFIFDPILFGLVVYLALRSGMILSDHAIRSLVIGGIVVAFFGVMEYLIFGQRSLSVYIFDSTASPNFIALYLAPLVAVTISMLRNKNHGYLWATLLLVPGILVSGSRGAWIGIGLSLAFLLNKWLRGKLSRAVPIGLGILVLVTTGYFARPDLSATPDSGRISTSNNIRYEIWQTSAEILTQNPRSFVFGVGLGNYQHYFRELTKGRVNYPEFIAPKALTPHNVFLAMWVNGGLVMLIAFVWLLVLAFRQKDALPAQAALVALIGHGLVDTPYFKNDLAVLFWILVVLVMVGGNKYGRKSQIPNPNVK